MPEYKSWVYEFIRENDVKLGEIGEFVSIPTLDEDAEFESLVARVQYRNERRKLNINKGNFRRLSDEYGTNTDLWYHKKFTLHLPLTADERLSKTKFIIEPVVVTPIPELKPLGKDQRISALKAKGVSDDQIADLESIGAL